jgi:small subunit ribosomal protein S21
LNKFNCYDRARPLFVILANLSREDIHLVQIIVKDNNIEQALRILKKKMQREGIFREMKMRRHYEKPSEKRVREEAESIRRSRKLSRKRTYEQNN